MKNERLRKYLQHTYEDSVLFDTPEIDGSIVGISSDHRIVYDAEKIAKELRTDKGLSADEIFIVLSNLIQSIDAITIGIPPLIVDFRLGKKYN